MTSGSTSSQCPKRGLSLGIVRSSVAVRIAGVYATAGASGEYVHRVSKSLLEQLPGIVAAGKRQAAQILDQLEGRNRVSLQTRELVIPSRDHAGFRYTNRSGDAPTDGPNRLIYGDNLLAMAALGRSVVGPPKTRAGIRTVPLPRVVVDAFNPRIKDRPPDEPAVTSPNGAMLRSNNWRRHTHWNNVLKTTHLAPLTIHELRHT